MRKTALDFALTLTYHPGDAVPVKPDAKLHYVLGLTKLQKRSIDHRTSPNAVILA